jgi:hypothetical protein
MFVHHILARLILLPQRLRLSVDQTIELLQTHLRKTYAKRTKASQIKRLRENKCRFSLFKDSPFQPLEEIVDGVLRKGERQMREMGEGCKTCVYSIITSKPLTLSNTDSSQLRKWTKSLRRASSTIDCDRMSQAPTAKHSPITYGSQ